MMTIVIDYDTTGRPTATSAVDSRDTPLTPLQVEHLRMGLEVVVLSGKRRLDYRPASQRP